MPAKGPRANGRRSPSPNAGDRNTGLSRRLSIPMTYEDALNRSSMSFDGHPRCSTHRQKALVCRQIAEKSAGAWSRSLAAKVATLDRSVTPPGVHARSLVRQLLEHTATHAGRMGRQCGRSADRRPRGRRDCPLVVQEPRGQWRHSRRERASTRPSARWRSCGPSGAVAQTAGRSAADGRRAGSPLLRAAPPPQVLGAARRRSAVPVRPLARLPGRGAADPERWQPLTRAGWPRACVGEDLGSRHPIYRTNPLHMGTSQPTPV
ncbi:MAG: hypothetical protein QOC86_2796 [Gaiellales bacterium]|nr:hypothetical protein [Gaiellales bacterium]